MYSAAKVYVTYVDTRIKQKFPWGWDKCFVLFFFFFFVCFLHFKSALTIRGWDKNIIFFFVCFSGQKSLLTIRRCHRSFVVFFSCLSWLKYVLVIRCETKNLMYLSFFFLFFVTEICADSSSIWQRFLCIFFFFLCFATEVCADRTMIRQKFRCIFCFCFSGLKSVPTIWGWQKSFVACFCFVFRWWSLC